MMDIKDNSKRVFTIGCGYNWSHTSIFDSIKDVTKSYKNMTFDITTGDSVFLQQKIITNELDIAMGSIPYYLVKNKDITYIPAFKSKLIVYAHKNHPLFSLPKVSDSDLENFQWVILRHSEESLRANEFYDSFMTPNRIQYNCKSVVTSLKLVEDSELLILLPSHFDEIAENYGLRKLLTTDILPEFESGIMFLKQNTVAEEIASKIITYLHGEF